MITDCSRNADSAFFEIRYKLDHGNRKQITNSLLIHLCGTPILLVLLEVLKMYPMYEGFKPKT